MGKRELLLIAAFVVVGVIVYQITAPPDSPTERGVSVSHIVDQIRRNVRGDRARADVTTATTRPVDATVTDLRLRLGAARIAVIGEDRSDLQADLHVSSTGYNDAEARQWAKQTVLKLDPAGGTLIGIIEYPDPGRQTATLTLRVPARLRVRIDQSGPVKVSNVAEVEMAVTRGDTTIERINGRVSGTHRSGTLNLVRIGSVRLTGRNSDLRITELRGDLTVTLQTGQLRGADLGGAIEIDATQAEIMLEKLDRARGMVRITAVAGKVLVKGLRTDARIDGRNTEIDVAVDEAAPLAVYNDGDDIALTPPPGGYRLDALAREGTITVPGSLVPVTSEGREQRASGAVKGGGPTITLRANRGDITIRARASSNADGAR